MTNPLSGEEFTVGGWETTFRVYGIFGMLWVILWIQLGYNSPEECPGITKQELRLIRTDSTSSCTSEKDIIANGN